MKCPKCDSILSLKNNRCDRCGEDVRVYKRVLKASNAFYNQGLMKAKVRDLSGAVVALKQSLELDKRNTNARNLLGMVYFEMGETVSALSEWVLSKHFQNNDNDADEYMNIVQSNPTKLENLNQAIKKYNFALSSAKQGNVDLAIIQLKKVISLNPKFIRAYQLLALLLIETGDKDKAGKMLQKASTIDVNNTLTLRYLRELGIAAAKVVTEVKDVKSEEPAKNGEFAIFKGMKEYNEDKPNIWAYLNLVIGVVLGIAVFYFLIVPTINTKDNEQLTKSNQELLSKISVLEADKSSLTSKNKELESQVKDLKEELASVAPTPDGGDGTTQGDPTEKVLTAVGYYIDNKDKEAALAIMDVDPTKLPYEAAKTLYNTIKAKTFESAAQSLYSTAYKSYDRGKYEEAIPVFLQAVALKENYEDAQYFLGRSYQRTGDNENAKKYFSQIVENNPTSKRGKEASRQLSKLK